MLFHLLEMVIMTFKFQPKLTYKCLQVCPDLSCPGDECPGPVLLLQPGRGQEAEQGRQEEGAEAAPEVEQEAEQLLELLEQQPLQEWTRRQGRSCRK